MHNLTSNFYYTSTCENKKKKSSRDNFIFRFPLKVAFKSKYYFFCQGIQTLIVLMLGIGCPALPH